MSKRTVPQCPACGRAAVRTKTTRNGATDADYRCNRCSATFDEPDEGETTMPHTAAMSPHIKSIRESREDGGET